MLHKVNDTWVWYFFKFGNYKTFLECTLSHAVAREKVNITQYDHRITTLLKVIFSSCLSFQNYSIKSIVHNQQLLHSSEDPKADCAMKSVCFSTIETISFSRQLVIISKLQISLFVMHTTSWNFGQKSFLIKTFLYVTAIWHSSLHSLLWGLLYYED